VTMAAGAGMASRDVGGSIGGIGKLQGTLRRGAAGTCASASKLPAQCQLVPWRQRQLCRCRVRHYGSPGVQSRPPHQVAGHRTLLTAVLTTTLAAVSQDRQLQAAVPQSTLLDGSWHGWTGTHDPPSHLHSIQSTPSSGFRHIEFTR
jgi:hypothetical protein